MAKDTILSDIKGTIKTNGAQEITGQALQNILVRMTNDAYSGLNKKQRVNTIGSCAIDKINLIELTSDIRITLESRDDLLNELMLGYIPSYDIELVTGDFLYTVRFPSNIRWAKDLELNPNRKYIIVIENSIAMYAEVPLT